MILERLNIDKSWSLFLDRDGVINLHYPGDYVKNWDEFIFLAGVKEALAELSGMFGKIVVVTNQQGVGKGLMSTWDLIGIHKKMGEEIEAAGGRIDKVFAATKMDSEENNLRKPGIAMGLLARNSFPEIDFSKSIMVGDSITDMQFGKSLGMWTVLIRDSAMLNDEECALTDFVIPDLISLLRM